ncbi:MAG: alpha/beta hydrolase [Spirochaetaceae bacterium]|jgi:acetyl esterase|nr:alpha/beta hydrolase [Spirochaetaceae bacterium]
MKFKIIPGPLGQESGQPYPIAAQEIKDSKAYKPFASLVMSLGPKQKVAQAARPLMGFDNKDITEDRISTELLNIAGPNGNIPIRLYSPRSKNLPIMLFFHGGGWIGGSVDNVENICKALADQAQMLVINVDYRLAPENPFPAGLEDGYAALLWAHRLGKKYGGDSKRIFLAGDSAGGNIATLCCTLSHLRQGPSIAAQLLIYPATDITRRCKVNPKVGWVPLKHYLKMRRLYLPPGEKPSNPLISPLFAEDLSYMPKSLVITTEFCYLREQGESYAHKMSDQGVDVSLWRYNGLNHAFWDKVGVWPQADQSIKDVAEFIKGIGS